MPQYGPGQSSALWARLRKVPVNKFKESSRATPKGIREHGVTNRLFGRVTMATKADFGNPINSYDEHRMGRTKRQQVRLTQAPQKSR